MRITRWIALMFISLGLTVALYGIVTAMPMFARRYGMACTDCHTAIPKLNADGMLFRSHGFRQDVDDIGKPDKGDNDISGHTSTRLQARYDLARTEKPSGNTDLSKVTFHEVTFYPATGAFAQRFASEFELAVAPEEPVEIENAWIRGAWMAGNGYVGARAGIFHPFEGFGASDRPLSISRPLFQTTSAKLNQKTFFTPWNFDQAGLEVGYTSNRTLLRATLFNGLVYDPEENIAHPATVLASDNAFAKKPNRPDFQNSDVQLLATQILTKEGGGLSGYAYFGALALPVDNNPTNGYWNDHFYRVAGYASYPVSKQVMLLGGVQYGKDETFTLASGAGPKSASLGYFGEGDIDLTNNWWLAGRYDWFDPSENVAGTTADDENETWAGTVALNKAFLNGLQFISEYRHKLTKLGPAATSDQKDDAFQTRLIWIW